MDTNSQPTNGDNASLSWFPPKTVLLIVAAMFVFSFIMYPHLPDVVPTHWGISGKADGFSSKNFGAFFAPVLGLGLAFLFSISQRMDPKRDAYVNFQKTWVRLQIGIITFFAYIHVVTTFAGIYPSISARVATFITCGMGVLFILIGNSMGKFEQNWFVGLRTPWTLSDPEIWRKSQRLGGLFFVLGGIAVTIISLTVQNSIAMFVTFFATIFCVTVIPIGYSYYLSTKKRQSTLGNRELK